MSKSKRLTIFGAFIGLPYAIAASFEHLGVYYGVASLLILGLFWAGTISILSEEIDKERAAKKAEQALNDAATSAMKVLDEAAKQVR